MTKQKNLIKKNLVEKSLIEEDLIERQLIRRSVLYHSPKIGAKASIESRDIESRDIDPKNIEPPNIESKELEFILEEPLSINIQGKTYSMIMRTPGDEKAHAAGFCLAEGVVDHPDDIADIALCDIDESNVAAVMLTPERLKKVSDLLNRNGFVSQTSCGICGREIIEDLTQILNPVPEQLTISSWQAIEIVERMDDVQKLKKRCQATHAALIFDRERQLLSSAEDVGRHNALDKAIGKLFLGNTLHQAAIALISSRASYEMIQKCARAGIEIVLSLSSPTALACDLCESLGMTLAAVKENGLFIFTMPDRIL